MAKQSFQSRLDELERFAAQQEKKAKYWTDLHNAVFGIGGKFSQLFATRPERERALRHEAVRRIRASIEALPEGPVMDAPKISEANGKILVRVPRSLHAALLTEAAGENVSLNQLIVAKLSLQLRALA